MKTKNIQVIDYKTNGNDIKTTFKTVLMQSKNIATVIYGYDESMQCERISTVCIFENFGLTVDTSANYNVFEPETERLKPSFLKLAEDYKTNFFESVEQAAKENKHIRATFIELYKQLGRPYKHLIESKNNFQNERLKNQNERILAEEKQQEKVAKEETERLKIESERFKNCDPISGDDFINICKIHGIKMHARTIGQINKVVTKVAKNSISYKQVGRRMPKFDKIDLAINELFELLNN